MKIDWFDFWLVFSWILLFFLLVWLIVRFFQWLKFRQELAYIKNEKVSDLVKKSYTIEDTSFEKTAEFKQEIDGLKKDIFFDLYDKNSNKDVENFDLEDSLEKLLDGKILDLIKEKDCLLMQKDSVIWSLEQKNQKILKYVVNKMFFLLQEKEKLLRDKDALIQHLKIKMQEIQFQNLDQYITTMVDSLSVLDQSSVKKNNFTNSQKPVYSHHNDFLNVNVIGKK